MQDFENRSHLREFPPYTSAVRRLQHSLPLRGVHRSPASDRSPPSGLNNNSRESLGVAGGRQRPLAVTRGRVANVLPAAVSRSSAQKMEELRRQNWEREVETRRLRALAELQPKAGRGRAAERNRGRLPVRASCQTPHRFEEEAMHNSTQSEEEEEESHASRNGLLGGHRPIQSPPIPALRGKLLLPSPRSEQHSVSNAAAGASSEIVATPVGTSYHETPPASRRRWRRQEVYVPQQPFGDAAAAAASPKERDSPQDRSRVDGSPAAGDGQHPSFVERQRSISVSGTRRNQSPSPDRRQQRSSSQDPLVHPELVTGCPTRRQDKILQQLFTLRQGLLVKQREMESHLVKVKP